LIRQPTKITGLYRGSNSWINSPPRIFCICIPTQMIWHGLQVTMRRWWRFVFCFCLLVRTVVCGHILCSGARNRFFLHNSPRTTLSVSDERCVSTILLVVVLFLHLLHFGWNWNCRAPSAHAARSNLPGWYWVTVSADADGRRLVKSKSWRESHSGQHGGIRKLWLASRHWNLQLPRGYLRHCG